jgi:WW domain-binding protein 4
MSEYWISKKKYFCKYCDIYIADDAPSRTHHENGMRHTGNKERFVKGLYKAGEKRKRDEEEERKEMKTVEAAAARAYALDVSAGRAGPSSAPTPAAPKAATIPPKKPSNPYTNYTTAAFLGYNDPDAERIQANLERRRMQGIAGEWEVVSIDPPSTPAAEADVKPSSDAVDMADAKTTREAVASTTRSDDDDSRAWKLRKKTAALGDIYDPGIIPIKVKAGTDTKAEIVKGSRTGVDLSSEVNGVDVGAHTETKATSVPKWTKIAWARAAAGSTPTPTSSSAGEAAQSSEPTSSAIQLETENDTPSTPSDSEPSPALESKPPSAKIEIPSLEVPQGNGVGNNLFKKRKAPSVGVGRGRRFQV